MNLYRLRSQDTRFTDELDRLIKRSQEPDNTVVNRVTAILKEVQEHGDPALLKYTRTLDHHSVDSVAQLEIPRTRMLASWEQLDKELRTTLELTVNRIKEFHLRQKQQSWEYTDTYGNLLGQRVTPLDRVGIYVPGGKASYPSSVLMNTIPAIVAGVPEIIMVTPAADGKYNELVLASAAIAGVDRAFAIGGAQAIAALAWGTQTIPAVDKITGPGNSYVAVAKKLVFGRVGIDMIAGPSEVLIIADSSADPAWVAMDMFAQLEHDEQACAIVLSDDENLLEEIAVEISAQLPRLQRQQIIRAALGNSALIEVTDLTEATDIANRIAPEHLELAVADPDTLLPRIRHAGAIFVGHWSAEVLGDYCAGPNHVLPTTTTARFSSPLNVADFQKSSSIIRCSAESAIPLARISARLATEESLEAHALSAKLRIPAKDK